MAKALWAEGLWSFIAALLNVNASLPSGSPRRQRPSNSHWGSVWARTRIAEEYLPRELGTEPHELLASITRMDASWSRDRKRSGKLHADRAYASKQTESGWGEKGLHYGSRATRRVTQEAWPTVVGIDRDSSDFRLRIRDERRADPLCLHWTGLSSA